MTQAGADTSPQDNAETPRRWIMVSDQAKPRPVTAPPSPNKLRKLIPFLWARKRYILLFAFAGAVAAGGVSLLVKNTYTATTVLLPPQQNQPALSALAGRLGEIANLPGARDLLRNPGTVYVTLLRSHTVAEAIIERFHLQQLYRTKLRSQTLHVLEGHVTVDLSKEGVITLSVSDHDPKRAAAMANAYTEELRNMCDRMAFTGASQRRVFFEQQAINARNKLADAEHDLQLLQENRHLLAPEQQVRALISSEAEIRSRIAQKQVEIQHLLTFRTPGNPAVMQAQHDLAALQAQLSAAAEDKNPAGARVMPEAGLAYARKLREVKYGEALLDALTRQVEAARIDESNEAVVLQTIDPAAVPDLKSRPMRSRWALSGLLLGGLAAIAYFSVRFFLGNQSLRHFFSKCLSSPQETA